MMMPVPRRILVVCGASVPEVDARGRDGGMRWPQGGKATEQGAALCARCGTRMFAPKPAAVREYALALFRPSLWYYANGFLVAGIFIAVGGRLLYVKNQPPHIPPHVGFAALRGGVPLILVPLIRATPVKWCPPS